MFETEQYRYAGLGGDYFWFEGKRRMVWEILENQAGSLHDEKILDVGCGPGYAFPEIGRWGSVHGLDPSFDALELCRIQQDETKAGLVNGSADDLPYRDSSFSLITAFEIFEHLDDDRSAMRECHRVLERDGRLVLTVPAFQWLWGDHDELYFHKRRYRAPEVRERLEEAGFEVERVTYCLAPFLAPLWLMRTAKKITTPGKKVDDFVRPPGWLNRLLTSFIVSESVWLKKRDLPWGVSIIGIARKR